MSRNVHVCRSLVGPTLLAITLLTVANSPGAYAAPVFRLETILGAPDCTSVDMCPDGSKVYARTWLHDQSEGYRAFDSATFGVIRDCDLGQYATPWSGRVSADCQYLWTTRYYSGTVVKVNLATCNQESSIPVGSWPMGLVTDQTRRYLYVGQGSPGTGANGSIKKIDTQAETIVGSAPLTGEPSLALALPAADDYLYVATKAHTPPILHKIRTADMAVVGTLPLSTSITGHIYLSISADGRKVYVPDTALNLVYVIDTSTMTQVDAFSIAAPRGFFVSPDGTYGVVVVGSNDLSISTFDIADETVCQTFPLSGQGLLNNLNSPVWDSQTGRVFIPMACTAGTRGGVVVLAESRIPVFQLQTILDASDCTSVDMAPDRTKLYARAWLHDAIEGYKAFDSETYAFIQSYDVGSTPWSGRVSAEGLYVWTTRYYSGTVAKLNLATGAIDSSIPVGIWPTALVADQTRRYLYVGEGSPGTGYNGSIKKIDTETETIVGSAPLTGEPSLLLALTSAGDYLYVATKRHTPSILHKIRTADMSVIDPPAPLPLPSSISGHVYLSVTADGGKVYVPDSESNLVLVVDTSTMTVVDTYSIAAPRGFFVSPGGTYAVVVTGLEELSISTFEIAHETLCQTFSLNEQGQLNNLNSPVWDAQTGRVFVPIAATAGTRGGVVVLNGPGPDTDGDDWTDCADNCPTQPNSDQADADADGIGNVCDKCPNDAANDADEDGVCGDIDQCPDTPACATVDSAGCPADGDADGVFDGCDECPDSPPGSWVNRTTGCPTSRADLDRDGDVDQTDFGIFQQCSSGPGVPADPECAD